MTKDYSIYHTGIAWELIVGDSAYTFLELRDLADKMNELGVFDD